MRKYVIMGIQGSGKGTRAKMLAADLDLDLVESVVRDRLTQHGRWRGLLEPLR